MSGKYTYKSLSETKCKIKAKSDTTYSVYSTSYLKAGEIIEECIAMETHITLEQLIDMGDTGLSGLFLKTIPFVTETENVTGLSIVGGNYIAYRHKPKDFNAVYQYDRRFDILTIRAIEDIQKGDEIFLPAVDISNKNEPDQKEIDTNMKSKVEKKKGCGCAEKAKLKQKMLTQTPENKKIASPSVSPVPPKILRNKTKLSPFSPEVTESPKFKSMVSKESLKSITVNK